MSVIATTLKLFRGDIRHISVLGQRRGDPTGPPLRESPISIRGDRQEKAELKLHLADGTVLAGRIRQFDQFNIQLLTGEERLYLIPKHAVV